MELCVPAAFALAAEGGDKIDRRVRQALRDCFRETRFMERVSDDLMKIFGPDEIDTETYDEDAAMPAPLLRWLGRRSFVWRGGTY